jgi:hypothetical protein
MFEFAHPQRMSMFELLQSYFEDFLWCHAKDVVPMVSTYPPPRWPLWGRDQIEEEDTICHVIYALGRWSAFRSSISTLTHAPSRAIRHRMADLVLGIQRLQGARLHLSDVHHREIGRFAEQLAILLRQFARDIKGTDSCVLTSKAAHFYLLGLIPAYDQRVIRNEVLPKLAWGCRSFENYVSMCWLVLQHFRLEGSLELARDAVADHMLSQHDEWTSLLPRSDPENWQLRSMDSVVAEYTLIQMARTSDDRYTFRRV